MLEFHGRKDQRSPTGAAYSNVEKQQNKNIVQSQGSCFSPSVALDRWPLKNWQLKIDGLSALV